jgi:hypothetical protein
LSPRNRSTRNNLAAGDQAAAAVVDVDVDVVVEKEQEQEKAHRVEICIERLSGIPLSARG